MEAAQCWHESRRSLSVLPASFARWKTYPPWEQRARMQHLPRRRQGRAGAPVPPALGRVFRLARAGRGMNVSHVRRLLSPVIAIVPRCGQASHPAQSKIRPRLLCRLQAPARGQPPSASTSAPSGTKRGAPAPCLRGGRASVRSRRHWLPVLPARRRTALCPWGGSMFVGSPDAGG